MSVNRDKTVASAFGDSGIPDVITSLLYGDPATSRFSQRLIWGTPRSGKTEVVTLDPKLLIPDNISDETRVQTGKLVVGYYLGYPMPEKYESLLRAVDDTNYICKAIESDMDPDLAISLYQKG